jgi:hypothetical protein
MALVSPGVRTIRTREAIFMKLRTFIIGLGATSAFALIASAALADPPERAGRISIVEGAVSIKPPQEDDWTGAARNHPVAPGESFWTGDDGRAELQIGAVETWLDSETELDVVDVDYGALRLALPQGSMSVRLWANPASPVAISTPAGDVMLARAGFYRVDVGAPQDDGTYPPVEVTVYSGAAQAPGPDGFVDMPVREAALIYPGAQPEMQDVQDASIDDWARQRAAEEHWREGDEATLQLTGFADLDAAGDFVRDAQYGEVWFPREIPADWAPYRFGHWDYVAPWGYTWIDDQPWGFAPFHYGRWVQVDGRWGWVRGTPNPRPVYAPALVAFIGGAGWNVSVGVSGGGVEAIGWVPLAPEEVYRPTYAVSEDYVRRVNVTNVTKVTTINRVTVNNVTVNNYRNAASATVVRTSAFSGGAPVKAAVVHVAAETIAAAPAASAAKPPAPPAARLARVSAAPPPAKLQVVRAAVVAHPAGSNKPPVIAGARVGPPSAPHAPAGTGAPRPLVAPAQIHKPAAQGRQPVAATPNERAPAPAATPAAASPAERPAVAAKKPLQAAKPADRSQPAPAAKPATETPAQAKARRDAASKKRQEGGAVAPATPNP